MRRDSLKRVEQSLSRTFTGMDWLDHYPSLSLQDFLNGQMAQLMAWAKVAFGCTRKYTHLGVTHKIITVYECIVKPALKGEQSVLITSNTVHVALIPFLSWEEEKSVCVCGGGLRSYFKHSLRSPHCCRHTPHQDTYLLYWKCPQLRKNSFPK